MRILNLEDSLSIVEIEDSKVKKIDIILYKNIENNNLSEIEAFIKSNLVDLKNDNVYVKIDASNTKSKLCIDFFLSISNIITNYIVTEESKFEEKRLATKIAKEVSISSYQINKLLNKKSIIKGLQIELYRKGKMKARLV